MYPYSPTKTQHSKEWDFGGQNMPDAKARVHTQASPETWYPADKTAAL